MLPSKNLGGAICGREGAIAMDSGSGEVDSRCLERLTVCPRDVSCACASMLIQPCWDKLLRRDALHPEKLRIGTRLEAEYKRGDDVAATRSNI